MDKLNLKDDFDYVKTVPNKRLHEVAPLDLSKVATTPSGRQVELRNIGRMVVPTDERGFIVPNVTKNGWCLGTTRHINTKHNCAMPEEDDRTFVIHDKNRNTQDPLNESELVLVPEKLLTFIHIYDNRVAIDPLFAANVQGYKWALDDFLQHVLLRNGFIPEDNSQKKRLHHLLEEEALRIIAPQQDKFLQRFKARSPFANIRMEDCDPDKRMEDAFGDEILYTP